MNQSIPAEPAIDRADALTVSFRDPAGSLFPLDGRIFRIVNAIGAPDMEAFLESTVARGFLEERRIAGTRRLTAVETRRLLEDRRVRRHYSAISGEMLVEHERIDFPSFPYEWTPEMLHAAGALTLELAQAVLRDGLGLKDATPYNVLFRGPEPVFIDVLCFERRDPGDATWLPYAQFVRTFLLPLLANRHFGLALDQILTTRRDGLEPEEVYRWCTPLQRSDPPFPVARHHADVAGRQAHAGRPDDLPEETVERSGKGPLHSEFRLKRTAPHAEASGTPGRRHLLVDQLHDHQQQLHGGPFAGQTAFRG